MHCHDDSAIFFEPLPDARQALPIGNRGLDLGPKGANLASFRRGLFPAPLCEPVSGFGNPLLLRFRVLFALGHLFDSLQPASTDFNMFRQCNRGFGQFSTFFDSQKRGKIGPQPMRRPKTLVVEHKGLSDEVVDFVLYFIGGRPLWASDDPDQLSATRQTDYFAAKSRPKAVPPAPL